MRNLVIFSVEELYNLIQDKPVLYKKNNTVYMSQDCYDKQNFNDDAFYIGVDLANGTDFTGGMK